MLILCPPGKQSPSFKLKKPAGIFSQHLGLFME